MGEVDRACDTKLNRDVTIKVLPEAFTTNPDRVACGQRPRGNEVAEALSRGFTLNGVLLQALSVSAAKDAGIADLASCHRCECRSSSSSWRQVIARAECDITCR
jgi:hypothetical protein